MKWFVFLVLTVWSVTFSQGTESLDLVDCPTAGIPMSGEYQLNLTIEPEGGSLFTLRVGFLDRFLIGFSYGGTEIIGSGEPQWNPRVEFIAKVRVIDELNYLPAISFGFNSQGHGRYLEEESRYQMKSKGFYVAAGKNLNVFGRLGVHGGANYSLEKVDGDALNFYAGIEKVFVDQLGIIMEYDAGLNDRLMDGGCLSCGVRWYVQDVFTVDFIFKNLNGDGVDPSVQRGLRISYLGYL